MVMLFVILIKLISSMHLLRISYNCQTKKAKKITKTAIAFSVQRANTNKNKRKKKSIILNFFFFTMKAFIQSIESISILYNNCLFTKPFLERYVFRFFLFWRCKNNDFAEYTSFSFPLVLMHSRKKAEQGCFAL